MTGAATWLLLTPFFALRGRRIVTSFNGALFGSSLGLGLGALEKSFYPERWEKGDDWILSNQFWNSLFNRFPSLSQFSTPTSTSSSNRQ